MTLHDKLFRFVRADALPCAARSPDTADQERAETPVRQATRSTEHDADRWGGGAKALSPPEAPIRCDRDADSKDNILNNPRLDDLLGWPYAANSLRQPIGTMTSNALPVVRGTA